MTNQATPAPLAGQVETILLSARSAGSTLIISRGHDPATIRLLLAEGLIRERLGHLVLTLKGHERRRACSRG
ncbi:hypothetical protein [Sphingomonas adhaesiva]|uniref:hypothetical protein n=1 Tax=Sphingomonas adhaesiva TaxID=28212 RepID=UPI002FFBC0C4